MPSPTQSYWLYNEKGQAVPLPRLYLVEGGKVTRPASTMEQEQARLTKGMVMTYITLGLGCLFIGGLIGLSIVWLLAHFTLKEIGFGVAAIGAAGVGYYARQWRKERRLGK